MNERQGPGLIAAVDSLDLGRLTGERARAFVRALVEEGRLSAGEAARRYIPEMKPDKAFKAIQRTLKELHGRAMVVGLPIEASLESGVGCRSMDDKLIRIYARMGPDMLLAMTKVPPVESVE